MRTCPRDDDKTRHHFWHQTFDVVDCLNPLTNLLLQFTDCPWFGGVNKLLQVAPNVKVKRGKVGNLAGQSTGPRRPIHFSGKHMFISEFACRIDFFGDQVKADATTSLFSSVHTDRELPEPGIRRNTFPCSNKFSCQRMINPHSGAC